ncbi:MBL fold metallo-hydrolase [Candidatus Woesearchaeota archaeon]|nr:MBL fold metallo-hydrolase [Candidatus Woesearchaeota archaeon]
MKISVIASGSNGNCCLIEKKDVSILIDAGKSGRETEYRMNKLGKTLENVDAIVITHSHHDHTAGAGVISRRYNIPIYISKKTFAESKYKIGNAEIKQFSRNFRVKGLEIKPIQTSHNVYSQGFMINDFGIFTDTGIITKEMNDAIPKLKAVLLESNYDIDMLVNGFYPHYLKQWILSDKGHLSNVDANKFIQSRGTNLSLVLLGHLSGNSNTPEIVKKTFEMIVKRKIECKICSRERETGTWEI